MQTYNYAIIFSLISLGFFGGFSHCSPMCGPFVIGQIIYRLKNTKLENFNNFQRLHHFALLPYHLGRVTTYGILGFFCSFIAQNLQEFTYFNKISAFLLLFSALFLLQNLYEKNIIGQFLSKIKFFTKIIFFVQKNTKLTFLFQNPQGFRGYFLGLILGLIPCGLLYAALTIAGAISNAYIAALAMFLFGLSTFPALFLTGLGGYFALKFSNKNFKLISKTILLINIITLSVMAISLILK